MTKATAVHPNLFWQATVVAFVGALIGVFGAFLFPLLVAQADESTLFFDGFEFGDFSLWTLADAPPWATPAHAPSAYSGTYKASVSDTGGLASLTKKVSTAGHEEVMLTYWYNIPDADAFEGDDHVYVEWYDGEGWNELAHYTDTSTGGWTYAFHELPAGADNNADFLFRFRADLGSGSDEFRLDDVELSASEIPEPGSIHAFKYHDMNGDGEFSEDGDTPIEGWRICLYGGDDDFSDCQLTDSTGWVWWMDLVPQSYYLEEDSRDSWFFTNTDYYEIDFTDEDGGYFYVFSYDEGNYYSLSDFQEGFEFEFGNTQYAIHALKFWDKNDDGYWNWIDENENVKEPTISGWNMCLISEGDFDLVVNWDLLAGTYKEEFREDWWDVFDYDEDEFRYFMITNGYVAQAKCQLTDEDGRVWWMELDDESYIVIEERRDNWFATTEDWGDGYSIEDGVAWVELGNGEDNNNYVVELEFGNTTQSIHAQKFFDSGEGGPGIRNWEICLYKFGDEFGPFGPIVDLESRDCQFSDQDGWVLWMDIAPGDYLLEETVPEGWANTTGNNPEVIYLEQGEEREVHFGNWIEDRTPPVSHFDDPLDHTVINTEILSLELTGSSLDLGSGVRSAELTISKIGDASSVQDFPASSFFDIFYRIECPAEFEPIETEIIAMSLTSVSPITVNTTMNWSSDWRPSGLGLYCFEVSATDYAGNVEHTAIAGPVAYVPVTEISNESTNTPTQTSFTVNWTTSDPATSRVIYDTVSHATLGEAPNYGYAFSTSEQDTDPNKVTFHSVVVSGLTPGTTYYYRVVSAASPESVGEEQDATTQSGGGGGGGGTLLPQNTASGGVTPFVKNEEEEEVFEPQVLGTETVTLYRLGNDDSRVYAIVNGIKRHIPTPQAFEANGFDWDDVVVFTPDNEPDHKNATLLRLIGDVKVYLVNWLDSLFDDDPNSGKSKAWIQTAEEFNEQGYNWNDVIDVPQEELDAYGTVAGVSTGDEEGTVVVKDGVTSLRVRTLPSLLGDIIGYISGGQEVVFYELSESGWYRIQFTADTRGWSYGEYLDVK